MPDADPWRDRQPSLVGLPKVRQDEGRKHWFLVIFSRFCSTVRGSPDDEFTCYDERIHEDIQEDNQDIALGVWLLKLRRHGGHDGFGFLGLGFGVGNLRQQNRRVHALFVNRLQQAVRLFHVPARVAQVASEAHA
jgi:hypothetical protein